MELMQRTLPPMHYEGAWQMMRRFTDQRTMDTVDELWTLEHSPVYTLGQAGRLEHLLFNPGIPIVETDRGGQITYHGPGQLMFYLMCDLRRLKHSLGQFIRSLEQVTLNLLGDLSIQGHRQSGAPGVYVGGAKIAALGLRVRRGCTYHGLALNVNCDLSPFDAINPCGYAGLKVTSLQQLGLSVSLEYVAQCWTEHLGSQLGYTLSSTSL